MVGHCLSIDIGTDGMGETIARFGPIGLTVFLIIWTIIVSPYSKYGDNWAIYPELLVFPAFLIWDVALIFFEIPRSEFMLYGIIPLVILFVIWMYCLMKISKDAL